MGIFDFLSAGKKWQQRFEREKQTRKEAEYLLEQKSLEIYHANQDLEKQSQEVKKAHAEISNAFDELNASQEELRQTMEELMSTNEEMERAQSQLKEANSKLKQNEQDLERKVKERTEEFLRAKEAAERANRVKSEFLANMSHELRTPLNAILGYAQILVETPDFPSKHKEKIKVINKSGEHLLGLINSVLDLSKIEAGRMELTPSSFDLSAMLKQIYDMFKLRCESKGLQLLFEVEASVPKYVLADEGKLKQCLINIIGNSVKFTMQGHVHVFVKRDPGGPTHFDIEDTGRGIPKDKIKSVLEPFTQVSAHMNTEGGTGLGLSITKKFIEMMGGTIDLTSEEGRGTTFFFDIPFEEIEGLTLADTKHSQQKIVGYKYERPVKILIVDDNPINRDVAFEILSKIGFESDMAFNGKEAIDKTISYNPDVILMDIRMPGVDGLQATEVIRHMEAGKTVKIIAVTASAFDQNRDEFLAKGCDGYIAKPYKTNFLLEEIANHIPITYEYEAMESDEHTEAVEEKALNLDVLKDRIDPIFLDKFDDNVMMGRLEAIKEDLVSLDDADADIRAFKRVVEKSVDEMNYDELERILAAIK